jgi:hypothetical protein
MPPAGPAPGRMLRQWSRRLESHRATPASSTCAQTWSARITGRMGTQALPGETPNSHCEPARVTDATGGRSRCPDVGDGRYRIVRTPTTSSRRLGHPDRRRVFGGAEDSDSAAGVFDHGEHVHPRPGESDRLEEVAGQQCVGLRSEEVGPGRDRSFGRRVDAGVVQDLPQRGRGHGDAEHDQFAVQPPVAPVGVLPRQA